MNEDENNIPVEETEDVVEETTDIEEAAVPTADDEDVKIADAPAPDADAVTEKKPKRLPIIPICIGGVVALALIVFAVISIFGGNAVKLVATGAENSFKALASSELYTTVTNIVTKGSVAAKLDLGELSDGYLDGDVNAKLYMSGTKAAATVDASVGGSSVLNAAVYADAEKSIVVESKELFGKTAYGIDLKNFAKDLEKSVFNPDMDTYYSLNDETYEQLMDILKDNLSDKGKDTAKSAENFAKDVISTALKSINTNADVDKSSEKLAIGDDEVKTSMVTINIDEKAFIAIAKDVVEAIKDSKDFPKLVENAGIYDDSIEIEEIYEMLDEFVEELEDSDLEDVDLSLKFWVAKSGKQLLKASLAVDTGYTKAIFSAACGPDWKDPTQIELSSKIDDEKTTLVYKVSSSTSKEYVASLKIKEDKTVIFDGDINWNKKDGDIKLTYGDYSVRGELLHSGSTVSCKVIKIETPWSDFRPTIELTMKEKDSVPSAPKYTNILSMKEEELDDFLDDVKDNVFDIMYELG